MGNYNPHIPQILGQEWVPIREQPLTLTPRINLVEVGHAFTLATSRTISTARFYLNDWPPDNATSQVVLASVYRHGTEDLTGPIQSVVIPCSLGTAFGGSVTLSGSAPNIAAALFSPSDNAYVIVNTGSTPFIDLRFDTEAFLPQLIGKRILGIDFLYTYIEDEADGLALSTDLQLGSGGSSTIIIEGLIPTNTDALGTGVKLGRQTVGEIDFYWAAPTISVEVLPWSPNRLRAFDDGSGLTERVLTLSVSGNPPAANQSIWYGYAAIEVFFCEEQRVLYGGRLYGSGSANYLKGANQITMRDLTDAASPALAVGDYDLVLSSADLSSRNNSIFPTLNQIQELYSLPSHPPVRVIRPFPLNTSLGKTFSMEGTLLQPQLSLHSSTGPLTEVHVYGRQAVAQVYGGIVATQEIYDTPAGGTKPYPWVRYYARRFGDTTVPLKLSTTSPAISGSTVDITPAEFDALDEVVDGWKEITLRFDTAPSMGTGTSPQWRWTAAGELVGNRWEVLGAYAPALSGAPFYPFNKVPSPHQLSLATYGAPASGSVINLGWLPQYAPPVSAVVDDETADATLMFAADLAVITGFGVTGQEQEVVGIGMDCGVDPCCIPTEIAYNRITWGLPANTGVAADEFTRTVVAGWGNADVGGTYSLSGPASAWSVNGTKGVLTFASVSTDMGALLNIGAVDFDAQVDLTYDQLPLTNIIRAGVIGRTDGTLSNAYFAQIRVASTGTVTLNVDKNVGGVGSTVVSLSMPDLAMGPGGSLTLRFMAYGTILKAKVWVTGEPEPENWDLETTDSSLTSGTWAGVVALDESAVTGHSLQFDNLFINPPLYYFRYNELQRMDTLDTDWHTIMKATSPAITSFNDYEARVGIQSSYRIRAVDVYDFPGPWSSTVTATVPEPGVTIGCSDGHLLIFTSNEQQDGSINLAYSSVWEGRVEESFAFPESRFVELQAMYNRDFFTAFRPTERGGEQFSRTVLVQAAAIDPETLADFTSLRDMAWANVSYICVRDEDGNRWFATVLVPSGRVLRDRRLYLAPVEVIEVTDTPSEVDPPWPISS